MSKYESKNGHDVTSGNNNNNINNHNDESQMWYKEDYKYYEKVSAAPMNARRRFIVKVYSIIAAQLVATFAIGAIIYYSFWSKVHEIVVNRVEGTSSDSEARKDAKQLIITLWVMVGVCVAGFISCLLAMCCCAENIKRSPGSYIYLSFFTLFYAGLIGIGCLAFQINTIVIAMGITCVVVVGLTLFAIFVPVDFTGIGPYLFVALLVLSLFGLAVGVTELFSDAGAVKWLDFGLSVASVLLFSLYLVYDTQLIMGSSDHKYCYSTDDYVFAAINLYMDIMELFMHILSILDTLGSN